MQIFLAMFLSLSMLMYTIMVRPFDKSVLNTQEILNESTVLISRYILLMYTEAVWEAETRYIYGWVIIALLGLSILLNFSFLAVVNC